MCFATRAGWGKQWLETVASGNVGAARHEGVKESAHVPISFVTEHIETLHEINIEAREEAEKLGIETFRMMPALGKSRAIIFIAALEDLGLRAVGSTGGNPRSFQRRMNKGGVERRASCERFDAEFFRFLSASI